MLCSIDLDGSALRHNYRLFCKLAGREKIAPVLKSNAYGHGLTPIYQALSAENPPWICTNYLFEAAALRRLGYSGRLLVVGPAVSRELSEAHDIKAELVVGNAEVLAAWKNLGSRCLIHIKFDTGMSRQGFEPESAAALTQELLAYKDRIAGVCTHFANVEDVTEHGYATQQLQRFHQAAATFETAGFSVAKHASSSASTLLLDHARFDVDRIGVSLYGVWPSALTRLSYLQINTKLIDLQPVLSWHTEVATVKYIKAGQFVGYGCTYRAIRDMRIAVLPVGYYEGYPRIAGQHGSYVLIHGKRCPVVGRICMNMMMVDTSHLQNLAVGDRVTLIGTDGGETIAAHEIAAWAQTIHYELLARLHPDIPRRLIEPHLP